MSELTDRFGIVDIHCHILPELDDGSASIDESLEMAELAIESGVTVIAATTHSNLVGMYENYETDFLKERFRLFENVLKQEKMPLKLVRGMEIFTTEDTVDQIDRGNLISLNGSNYYLMEFSFDEPEWYLEQSISMMLDSGRVPVIAHPERYYCLQDHPEAVFKWTQKGAMFQVNKGSILGRFGERVERTADILMDHGLVTCIGSDAHKPYMRTTEMREIDHYIRRHYSEEISDILLRINPRDMLMNRELKHRLRPVPFEQKRWIW